MSVQSFADDAASVPKFVDIGGHVQAQRPSLSPLGKQDEINPGT